MTATTLLGIFYGILLVILAAHTFVAATATMVTLRDRELPRGQMVAKIAFSWLVPYLGPLLVIYAINEHSPELIPKFVHQGICHAILFRPIPPSRRDSGAGAPEEGSLTLRTDWSDPGDVGEGSCGADH